MVNTSLKPIPVQIAWVLCFAALLLLSSCAANHSPLVIGYTTEQTGKDLAEAVAEVLTASGLSTTLHTNFESADELAAALEGGVVDLALMEEPLTPNPQLRMLMPLYPSVLHALYSNELGAPDLPALLAADPVYAGPPQSMGWRLVRELAAHYQLPGIDTRLIDTPWVPAPNSPPRAYLIFGGLLTPEARLGFTNYQLFAFTERNKGSAAALSMLYPNLSTFTLPAGIYPSLTDRSIETLAVETLLVARPTLDSELAYGVIAALREQPQALEQTYPLSRASLSRPIDHSIHTLALHSGAKRYINKDEPGFLERYAEVLALGATLLLAFGTALTTFLRSRRQGRKDRLDAYFLRLQDLRTTMHEQAKRPAELEGSLAKIVTEVTNLEAEVLQLLVEERLAVDSALVSFFLLSESIRRQAEA